MHLFCFSRNSTAYDKFRFGVSITSQSDVLLREAVVKVQSAER